MTRTTANNPAPAPGVVLNDPQAQRLELWLPEAMGGQTPRVELSIQAPDGGASRPLGQATAVGEDRLRFDWPDELPRVWWHVNEPRLYRLTGRIEAADRTLPVDCTFGLRWWSTQGKQIRLNDKPFYVRGCIRGITTHDHPNLTGLPEGEAHAKNIDATKAFGFNYVRWHSTIPSEAYLDAADRLGIAVQVELGFEYDNGNFRFDAQRWEQTIRRISRRPSVAVYCLGNEIHGAGQFDEIQSMIQQARAWDPAPLVMDNCGWGEPDRPGPDVYCQHVAYFFPYGDHARMFDRIQGFELEGFCQDPTPKPGEPGSVENPLRPVSAHEVCHYIAMRDLDRLEEKWKQWNKQAKPDADHPAAELPWWVDELRRLYRDKGIDREEPQLRHASQQFQALAQRHVLESIRLSPTLQGYQMLQMADCWKYENTNGLIDAFDDPIHWDPRDFARFNADSALVMRFEDERGYAPGDTLRLPACLSHYGEQTIRSATLHATLTADGQTLGEAELGPFDALEPGRLHELGEVALSIPGDAGAAKAELTLTLRGETTVVENHWPVWILPAPIEQAAGQEDPRVVRELTPDTLAAVAAGEHRLWLYRPGHLFDKDQPRPALDFAGRRELMKGVIWDRGDNLGALVRDHPALGDLPHDGFADWQFAPLLHHGAKINLDGFPVPIQPIVQGVDRPVRDRMEVKKLGKGDFDPANTCRRWGWLFELAIGEGRLLVCGLNLDAPSVVGRHLLGNLLGYLDQPTGDPSARLDARALQDYLAEQAQTPLSPPPPMTDFWLRDDLPVETTLFWEELNMTLR